MGRELEMERDEREMERDMERDMEKDGEMGWDWERFREGER